MKIAFFIDEYLPSVHGVATSTTTYKEALEKLGHEVYIIAPHVDGYEDFDDHIIRMPSSKSYVFEKREMANIYPGLAKKLDDYHFDIVHSQTQFFLGILAHSVAKRQNIPHVTTIHTLFTELIDDYPVMITAGLIAVSLAFPVVLWTKPVMPKLTIDHIKTLGKDTIKSIMSRQGWQLTAAFANKCDACISPSKHLADILVNEGGLTTPYFIFPNSIDTKKYLNASADDSIIKKGKDDKFIICVARLSPEKRQVTLVEAMSYIKDPHIKLVLAGGGSYEKELKARIKELKLEDRVILTGMCSRDQVASLLKQADVFALASYHFDNQPMTFLEASAAGLPIVYCDERMTEALTKENSILTDGIEGKDFAKVFENLLNDPAKLDKLSKGALKVAKKFDSEEMAKKLVKLYKSLIKTHANLEEEE